MLSRRKFLVFMGALLFSSCSHDERDRIDSNLAQVLDELSMREWSVQMGKELYDATPKQYNSVSINELFNQYFSLSKVGGVDEFKKAVSTKIMNDFRDNRIRTYQGWIFSQKEAVLYVLAFRFINLKKGVL